MIKITHQPITSASHVNYVNFPALLHSNLTLYKRKKKKHILSVVFTLLKQNKTKINQNRTFDASSFHKVRIPHFDRGIQGPLKSESSPPPTCTSFHTQILIDTTPSLTLETANFRVLFLFFTILSAQPEMFSLSFKTKS